MTRLAPSPLAACPTAARPTAQRPTQLGDSPYRHAETLQTRCATTVGHETCGEFAYVRCRHCGRPSCLAHVRLDGRCHCQACEQAFGRKARRIRYVALAAATCLSVGLTVAVMAAELPLLALVAPLGLLIGATAVAEMTVAALRLHFRRRGRFAMWIDNAPPIQIGAADTGGEYARIGPLGGTRSPHRPRGEMPVVPIWQRTYGVG